jgi:hypothetical protein
MSSTRYAPEGAPLKQERFASSGNFQRGLMANLVVKRTEALDDPRDRELIWFLQLLSHQDGGLGKVAKELCIMSPERIGTRTMQKRGTRPGQIYSAGTVRQIRDEIEECCFEYDGANLFPFVEARGRWPLKGEREHVDLTGGPMDAPDTDPTNYPAATFVALCQERTESLPDLLTTICLDPTLKLSTFEPYFFPTLIDSLRDYMKHWIEERTRNVVTTEVGRRVADALDYTADRRIMSLIDGLARIGKSFSAKHWCDANPARARYVQVPSGNDDFGFFRAMARALGVSITLNSKAHHLRDRVEDVLQSGQLTVVFDEAHWLWPNSNARGELPKRINWINTALVNHGVPVALVTTPQFFVAHSSTVEKAHWNSDQFDGRLMHYERLPESLSKEDLAAVAKSLLPEGDSATIRGLVAYAQASAKYLAGIGAVVTRARYLASRAERAEVTAADVRRAMQESVIPSDKALAETVQKAVGRTALKRRRTRNAEPLQDGLNAPEEVREKDTFTGRNRPVAALHVPANSGRTPALEMA